MQTLSKEQEVLMNIADMSILTYQAESVLLRVDKLIKLKGEAACEVQIAIAKTFIYDTADRIEKAAKDADVYQNIIDFPKGFETMLGERGITLSGGQKQRVSIARAIAKEPKIMILDDCLSAVDTKTENAILTALKKIMENRTSIIISHRVSSAKLADQIIVLDEGRIIEQGNHETLMAKKGVYAELFEKQTNSGEPIEG